MQFSPESLSVVEVQAEACFRVYLLGFRLQVQGSGSCFRVEPCVSGFMVEVHALLGRRRTGTSRTCNSGRVDA